MEQRDKYSKRVYDQLKGIGAIKKLDYDGFCKKLEDQDYSQRVYDQLKSTDAIKKLDYDGFKAKVQADLAGVKGGIAPQPSFADVPEDLTVQRMDSISTAENAKFGTEFTHSGSPDIQRPKTFMQKVGDFFVQGALNSTEGQMQQRYQALLEREKQEKEREKAEADRRAYAADPYLNDDIARSREDVTAGKFKPKDEESEQDIFDNQSELYRRTPDGEKAYAKMAGQVANVERRYAERFAASGEFRKLQEQYKQQLEAAVGDDAKAAVDERFNALVSRRMEDLYGDEINEKTRDAKSEYSEAMYKARRQSFDGAMERYKAPLVKAANENTLKAVSEELDKESKRQLDTAISKGYLSGENLGMAIAAGRGSMTSEGRMLATAKERLEENKRVIDAAINGHGFWKAMGESFNADNWTMGINEYLNSKNVRSVIEKADKGEELTAAEQAVMDATALEVMANQYYAYRHSRLYKMGQTTGASIPFMVDFMLNPLAGTGKSLAKAAVKWGVKRGLAKGAVRMTAAGARLGGDILGAAGMTATTGLGRVAAGTEQRMVGDVMADISGNAELGYKIDYNGRYNRQEFGTALWNSAADNWIENYSEMALGAFDGGGKMVKRWIKDSPLNGLSKSQLAQASKHLWQGYGKLQKKAQFHGYLGEVSEEYLGNLMRLGVTTDTKAEDVFSADAQIDTWLGLLPTSVFFAGTGAAGRGINKYNRYKKGKEYYKNYLESLTPEERRTFDIVQQHIDNGDTDFAKGYIKETLKDPNLTAKQKHERLEAVYGTMYNKGYDDFKKSMGEQYAAQFDAFWKPRIGDDGRITVADMGGTAVSVLRQNADGTYRVIDADGNESDVQGASLTKVKGFDYAEQRGIAAASQVAKDITLRRYKNGDRITDGQYEGEIASMDDGGVTLRFDDGSEYTLPYTEIENGWNFAEEKRMDDAAKEIDAQANADNGHVTNVRIGGVDGTFYVKSGKLTVTANKEGMPVIDKENSDNTFTVVNSETGEAMQVGIDRIAEVLGDAPAQELKEQSNEAVRQAAHNEREYPVGSIVYNERMPNGFTSIVGTDGNGIAIQSLNERTGQVERTTIPNEQRGTWHRLKLEPGNLLQTQTGTVEIVEDNGADGYTVSIDGEQPQRIGAQELADMLTAGQFDAAAYEAEYGQPEQEQTPATEQEQQQPTDVQEPLPIGKGAFGNIYNQFKGKVKEAFSFLLKHKSGDLLGVFQRSDIGEIDLVWGDENMGVAHIIDKHVGNGKDFADIDEAVSKIDDIIQNGNIIQNGQNRYVIEKEGYRVGIRKDFNGDNKNWVVTAIDYNRGKEEKGIATNPTSASHGANGSEFAAPDNSESKGTQNNPNAQEDGSEFSDEDVNATVTDIYKRLQKQKEFAAKPISLIDKKAVAKREAAKQEVERLQQLYDQWNGIKRRRDEAKTAAARQRMAEDEKKRAARRQTQTAQLPNNTPAERWQAAPKAEGNAVTRTLADGTVIKGHYVLVEAGAATPSHDPFNGWNTSNGFPVTEDGKNINDRDYKNDTDAQQITTQIAQTYDGQAVAQVPVVSSEGIVYDGNGRTIAGNIAAANDTDGAYIKALADNAGNFGFTAEQVAGMRHPRVYMQTDEDLPYNTTTFAKFNAQEKKSQGSANRAVSSGRKLTEAARDGMLRILDNYGTLDAFFASETGAKDIVSSLLDNGIITQQEVAGLTEATDKGFVLSPAGKDYVTDLLIGGLFDEQTIRMLGNDKGLKQSVLRALPSIVENRRLGDYALTGDINNAIRLLYEARQAGMAYSLYIRQIDAFEGKVSDRFSPFEMLLAEEMSSGVETFRQVLNLYNNSARDDANGQTGLFEPRTIEDIKNEILRHYGKSTDQSATTAAESTQGRPADTQTQPPVPSAPTGTRQERDEADIPASQERLEDKQGNPIDKNGNLLVEPVESINDISDEDFDEPQRNVALPTLPDNIANALGLNGRPVVIKKNVFEKNRDTHEDLSPEDSREILSKALYNTNLYGQSKPISLPEYRVAIETGEGKNSLVVLDVYQKKDKVEIVGWRHPNQKGLERLKRQIEREDGQLLILSPNSGSAAALSALPSNSSDRSEEDATRLHQGIFGKENRELVSPNSASTDKGTTKNRNGKEKTVENANPSGNRLVTDERYEELKQRMKMKLRGQLNMGIDPEILAIGTEMAVYHIEKGARKFAEFAKRMAEDLGDKIRPYLKAFYNGARDLPEMEGLAKEMDDYATVAQTDINAILADEEKPTENAADAADVKPIGVVRADKDTRDNSDIWVVKPSERVSREEFAQLRKRAKANGGYWSTYKKGFLFADEADANNFNNTNNTNNTNDGRQGQTATAGTPRSVEVDDERRTDTATAVGQAEAAASEAETLASDFAEQPTITESNGYKKGDRVIYDGNEATIYEFDPCGMPILDTGLAPIVYTGVSDWSMIRHADGTESGKTIDAAIAEAKQRTVKKAIDKIDNATKQCDEQLALLGYYEDTDTVPTETGVSRSAEKAFKADLTRLAKQLCNDLGVEVAKSTKGKAEIVTNIAPAGGNGYIKLQLPDSGKFVYISVSVEPTGGNVNTMYERGNSLALTDAYIGAFLFRIDEKTERGIKYGDNNFAGKDVTYGQFVEHLRKIPELRTLIDRQTEGKGVAEIAQDAAKRRKKADIRPSEKIQLDLFGGSEESSTFENAKQPNKDDNGRQRTELRNDGRRKVSTAQTEPSGQPRNADGALGGSEQPQDERPVGGRMDTGSEPHRLHDGERSGRTPVQPTGRTAVTPTEPTDIEPSQWRNTHNFHALSGERLAPTAPKARYEANLAAIRLLKQLQDEGRQATAQEMDILAQYSGWGGLGEFFKGEPGTTYYSQQGEQSPYQVLQSLLTDEELQAAQLSRNSAYYTPESVINSMWQVAERLGFKGGNILEGSAGIGNIFALMPSGISHRSNLTAVEIDDITAGILAQLYPDATTYHAGFQDVDIPNNSQDLVITNVPFVTGLHVYDKQEKDLSKRFGNIHDFCIAKNVRKLKQGGLGIFISSSGTLDNSKDLRVWLNNEGDTDVIGAFRLNRDTFGGTSTTSDIIVVRKRVNGQKDPRSIDVLDTATDRIVKQPQDEVWNKKTMRYEKPADKDVKLVYNKYFVEHPLSMGGEMGFGFEHGDTRWGGTTAGCYPEATINQSARLKDWIDSIEQSEQLPTYDELKQGAQVPNGTYETYEGAVPYGSLILNSKGEICKAYHGTAVPVEGINSNKVKGYSKSQVLKDYNAIKQAIDNLLQAQTKNVSDSELKPYLQQLNKVYDDFVRKYGNLNRNTSLAFLRNDVQWASVAAIEKVKETVDVNGKKKIQVAKTDLFSKRVVGVQAVPKAENTRDGIILSMQQFGTIRPDKIAEWLGKPTDEVEKEIIDTRLGFRDPQTGNIQVRHEYLSGNVREKLAYAEEHNEDGSLNANIEELRKVIPIDIPAHLIEFNIGSTWIPKELYLQYAKEKYDLDNLKLNHVGSAWVSNDVWGRNEKNRSEGVYSDMLGIQIYGHELMLAAMNNVPVVVSRVEKHSDGTSETRTDKVASAACSDKISQIKDDFVDWARGKMQQDSELADRIQKIYNDRFNAIVPMLKVDKEFLSEHLPGQNSAKYTLYPHQQQAVARGLTQALMLAHEVGTGKTISLISTAMEMRRLGTAKKPMIVVQNATTQQFVADAKDLYPNAKILTVSDRDRTAEGRQEFYAKIKYNDWDLIIVPQSVFDMIPDSEARMRDFINEKIEEKMHAIEAAKEAGLDNNVTKRMERELGMLQEDLETNNMSGKRSGKKAKEKDAKKEAEQRANTEAQAQAMLDRKTDDIENFDEMGIDALLIDEAHNYKHLGFATMMTRGVKGVDPSYSKRAAALYLKCQSIYERNGHKNVIFATGTPISNTAAEIWTFMKYLMPKQTLQENEIYYFDDFVHNFGKINEQLEFATNGKFKANNRFAQYGNVPELMRLWLSVADCTLTREVGQVNDKVPELEGGKAQDIFLPQSPSLIDIMSAVRSQLEMFEKMSGKEKRENSYIPLTMYGIAKRAAIDPRLVDANAVDEPLSKTNRAVEEILRSLNDSKKYKGTVAIFCDSYQNKQSGFNLFNDIKEKLTKQGVSSNQIAIIRSEMSDSAKQKIFDAVREGDIRVIMGSTQTLGTGVNIQTRLHTLIHMDAPDRPMDYTQRNGRILRQGNMHKEWGVPVRVLRFGVEDSLDVTSYQRLKTKAGFIDSVMNGKSMIENNLENRVLEDVDEGIFDNPVAMLSGSQYALLKSQAERDLRKWSARAQQYRIDQILIAKKTKDNEKIIAYRKQKIADNEKLIELLSQTFPGGKVSEYNINGTVCHTAEEVKNALKEVNKDVTTESDALRKDVYGSKKALSYPITLNGVPFNVDVQLTRKVSYKDGQSIVSIEKEVLYSAPTLGIEPISSPTKVIDRLIDMIQDDIISGKQARDENAYSADYIKRLEKENALMREREGKPFEHQVELEKAQTLVDEYTKKMQAELAEKEAKYANQSHNSVNLDKMDSEDDTTDTAEAQYDELDYDADNLTDAQQLATDAVLGALDDAGISVERVSEEEAEREVEKEKSESSVRLIRQMAEGTKGQSNNPITAAKVQKKLEDAKEKYKKYGISTENAITDISKALGARNTGTSNYITIEAKNGTIFTLRLSNHNATVANFDNNGETNGISIVISRHNNKGITNNGDAHIVEFFYSDKSLNKADGTPIADIIGALEQTMYSGEYTDPTGLAQRQEVNIPAELQSAEFSIRQTPAPKNTGIGYKVFYRGKDGKLYPPMVANPNGADTPIGVWLNADAAPISGESKTGRPQVKAGGKGTQGGSGQLAYRPGWHLGEIPYALQFNRKDENGDRTLFPKDFVWAEVEYAADVNYQQEAEKEGVTENGKYRYSYAGLKHLPTDGYYRYKTNPNPETDPWIITGAMKVNRVLTNEEVDALVLQAGREPQQREFLRTSNGTIYGYAKDGKIYLTDRGLNPNTPIHEYTHLWDAACRRANPELWRRGVELMRRTPLWDEVKNDPNYANLTTDDEIAGEVHARLAGRDGAAFLERMAEEAEKMDAMGMTERLGLVARLKKWMADFWRWTRDTFAPWTKAEAAEVSLDDFVRMPLADLARGVNPNKAGRSAEADATTDSNSDDDIRFSIGGGAEGKVAPEALPQELVGQIQPSEGITDYAVRLNATMNGYTQERTQQMYDEVDRRMRKGGKLYAKLYKHMYDKYRPLDRFQRALAEQGALLNVQTDAYNDIFRSIGRASTAFEEFYKQRFRPLTAFVRLITRSNEVKNFDDVRWADDGKEMTGYDKFTLYLRAKDMVEASKLGLVERGAEGFADFVRHKGSMDAWTPQEYVEAFEKAIGKENVEKTWALVNGVNKWSLDYMNRNGFIDDETTEKYKGRKFYVPQRGFEEGESKPARDNARGGNFGKALRKANGRKSLAADPLAYMANIAESTIMATQKNRTKQKMLLFCMANMRLGKETGTFDIAKTQYRKTGRTLENGLPEYEPFYGFIPYAELKEDAHNRREAIRLKNLMAETEDNAAKEELQRRIDGLEAKIKYAPSVRYDQIRPDTGENADRHRVDVVFNGKKYSLLFADEDVAAALNRENPEMGNVIEFLNTNLPFIPKTTQYFSRILTQQNPAFALWNLFRDAHLGLHTNLLEHPTWTADFAKNLVVVQRAVAAYAFKQGKATDSTVGKYLQEYFAEGAQTGYSFINSMDDLRKKIAKDLNRGERFANYLESNKNPLRLFSNITEWSELTVRVAQYVTAREHGYTPEEAATEAKEVSTNFDRKGNLRMLYSLFSFFNAAMQGTNKHIRQIMNGHGVGLTVSLVLYAVSGFLNTFFMPDDPDDEMCFTEFDRMQNICLGRVRIPLPPGLRGFWALGVQAALAFQGRKTLFAAAVDGASFLAGELSPINPLGGFEVDGSTNSIKYNSKLAFREFVPTAAQPFYDVANNTTFNGSTVYRTPFVASQEGKIPQTKLGKRNVNALAQRTTDKLFEFGGGDPKKNTLTKADGTQVSGFFDVNPSKVEYLLKSVTGGLGQFAMDLYNTVDNAFNDKIKSFDDFATTMPVIKRAWKPYKEEKEAARAYWLLKGRVEAASKAEKTMPEKRKAIYLKAKRKLGEKGPESLTSKQDIKEMNDIIVEWNKNYW